MFSWFIIIAIFWLAFGAFLQSWFDYNEGFTDGELRQAMITWMFFWPIFLLMEFVFWIGNCLVFVVLTFQEYIRSKRE